MHLGGGDAEVVGQPGTRGIHPLARLGGSRERVVGLHLQAPVVLGESLDDRPAGVRAARVLEECLLCEGRLGKGWKLAPHELEIELHRAIIASTRYACHQRADSSGGELMVSKPLALLMMTLAPQLVWAQSPAPDTPEPGSIEEIAKATTEARFLSPWVSYLPASASVVSPRRFLHRLPGAAGEFVDSATAYAYCRALAASSPRVRMFTIGRSEEGRDIVLLAIADEAGIQQLEQLKAATAALADPRSTTPSRPRSWWPARAPIYYLNAGLHSDETGSTESVLELAYRLAVSEQPMIRRIRENLVVLINPVSNPDGRDKQVEWFYRYLKGKTDLAKLPRQAPPYWSKYAYVDINRDAHQQVHETTKAVFRMFFELAPAGDSRPARERGAAGDVERHRSDQRARRSDHLRRASGAQLP